MEITNIHNAKTHLSALLEKVALGKQIIIAKAGKPVALLSPYHSPGTKKLLLGAYKGKIKMAPDFDELPKEIMKHFTP